MRYAKVLFLVAGVFVAIKANEMRHWQLYVLAGSLMGLSLTVDDIDRS